MAFSCTIEGKNKENLLKKYGINPQLLNIAPPNRGDAFHALPDIRDLFDVSQIDGENVSIKMSKIIVQKAQAMVRENLENLSAGHCETCRCPHDSPNWDIEAAQKFLAIQVEEVCKAYGG